MFKKLLFVPLIALSLFLVGCDDGGSTVSDDDVVRLGLITPLTGDLASLGEPMRNATEDYLEMHPEWAGMPVELFVEDGKCNPQDGASAAQKLINVHDIHLLLSAECSGVSLAVAPIAEAAKVPVLSSTSTSPELSGISDFFFRTAPSDVMGGRMIAQAVVDAGYSKVGLLVTNTDFATAYADQFELNFDGEIVKEFVNDGVADFKTVLQKFSSADVDALVHMNQNPVSAGFVARQNVELGMDYQIYSTDATAGDDFFSTAKDAAEGQIIVITQPDKSREDTAAAIANYVERHGESSFEAYQVLQLDAIAVFHQAVESVGLDGVAIRDYLRGMEAYSGLAGDIEFDENGDSSLVPSFLRANAETKRFELIRE
jgi:branched-chain amino acid transport system substrate-binding protein